MNRYPVSTRSLATIALVGLSIFPLLVVTLNVIQRDHYHLLSQAISELALGRDGWLMAIAFCAAATGMLSLAIILRRTVARSIVAPALLAISALLTYVSAFVHTDGENAKTTLHGQIHQTAGILTFVLVIAAMFVSSRRFRRDPAWQRLARPTVIWGICAVAAFFLIPAVGNAYFGLAQRILIASWLTWLITTAAYTRQAAVTAETATLARSTGHTAQA